MSFTKNNKVTFITFKWGTKYPSFYVNRLYNSIRKTYSGLFDFYCITDDPSGLICKTIDINKFKYHNSSTFCIIKLELFSSTLGITGPKCYIDLDMLVLGDLAEYFDQYKFTEGRFIYNYWSDRERELYTFHRGECYMNSSLFTWNDGQLDFLFEFYEKNKQAIEYKYKSIDMMVYYCFRHLLKYHPRKIVYAYSFGADNPTDMDLYKYREDYKICMFNTSHGSGVELDQADGWAKDLWLSRELSS